MAQRRSAVVVPVPEASGAVDEWRERTCTDKPSHGVPPHITLVVPFVPPGSIDVSVISALGATIGRVPQFAFALRRAARFPNVLYLSPDPADGFARLTESIVAAFPGFPPYEGAIGLDKLVPHLTVAQGDAGTLDEAQADVERRLPIHAHAHEALLLEEGGGRWVGRARLALAV